MREQRSAPNGLASFARNGKSVIVALGARNGKVGSEWVPFCDTVMIHAEQSPVSLEILEERT
jgi:hypothetical protein